MADFKKQINKGVLELAVLKLINDADLYGYAIIQEIRKQSDGKLELKDGTLYPILYRLEDNGFIESYWKEAIGRGKPRKYYKIMDSGVDRLHGMIKDYEEIAKGIKNILRKGK